MIESLGFIKKYITGLLYRLVIFLFMFLDNCLNCLNKTRYNRYYY